MSTGVDFDVSGVPKCVQNGSHNGPKLCPEGLQTWSQIKYRFLVPFWTPFWVPKWSQNGSKMGVQEEPFLSLEPFGCQDWPKRCPRGTLEAPESIFGPLLGAKLVPKWCQRGAFFDVGARWPNLSPKLEIITSFYPFFVPAFTALPLIHGTWQAQVECA